MMMSGRTFRDFYGISNPDGSINYTRAAQVARQGGLGVTFEGTFGVIELSSNSSEIDVVVKGDSYIYKLDGEFYGIGGGGNGHPVQDPYTHEYKGFKYNFSLGNGRADVDNGGGLSDPFLASKAFAATVAAGKSGLNVINKELAKQNLINNQLKKSLLDRTKFSAVKAPKAVKFVGKYGGSVFTAWSAYDVYDQWEQKKITTGGMLVEQTSNLMGAYPVYGTAWSIGWNLGGLYGPSKWYGEDDTKWFE